MPNENDGISNKTIAILIILALVISVIGTWAVLNGVATEKQSSISGGNIGVVTLNIAPPKNSNNAKVVLEIK